MLIANEQPREGLAKAQCIIIIFIIHRTRVLSFHWPGYSVIWQQITGYSVGWVAMHDFQLDSDVCFCTIACLSFLQSNV